MSHTIRAAIKSDAEAATALLPDLADFTVPAYRNPDHLWQGDAKLLGQFFAGEAPHTHTLVAVGSDSNVVGIAMYTLRKELISSEPSAHLEVLSVDSSFRKQGIGRALIQATEKAAKALGAQSLTLHVFSNNTRARSIYASVGFEEELLRCYKPL